jgi:hypothetical protein
MSGFTTSPGIGLINVDGSIDIWVKCQGGTVTLFKDSTALNSWGSDPNFNVPCEKVYAIYFRLTPSSDTGTIFPADPFDWDPSQPSTITYEKMLANQTAFSIKDDNSAEHSTDHTHSFDLLVNSGSLMKIVRLRTSEIDPTIVEKGEEG